jgi:hypothetical protein
MQEEFSMLFIGACVAGAQPRSRYFRYDALRCRFSLLPYAMAAVVHLHVLVISSPFQKGVYWVAWFFSFLGLVRLFSGFWKLAIFVPECRPPGIAVDRCFKFFLLLGFFVWLHV